MLKNVCSLEEFLPQPPSPCWYPWSCSCRTVPTPRYRFLFSLSLSLQDKLILKGWSMVMFIEYSLSAHSTLQSTVVFCPLLKSAGNPYPKICDFSQLFIADAPIKEENQQIYFYPAQSAFWTPSTKIFKNFLL